VLKKSNERILIDPGKRYKQVTVRLWGNGAVLRAEVGGAEVSYSKPFLVHTDQLIVSRIDARHGAIGIVPPDLDGAIASPDFPVFALDKTRIIPGFLDWMSKSRAFVHLCRLASEGTTNRVRIKEEGFLAIGIPLPSLSEQSRIVTALDAIASKIEEARGLRKDAERSVGRLVDAAARDSFSRLKAIRVPLSKVTSKIGSGSTPRGGRSVYLDSGIPLIRSHNVRMRNFQWDGMAFIDEQTHTSMKGTQVQAGDVLLNITGASIGRVACAPSDMARANVSQHVSIIRPIPELDRRFLMFWLSQPAIQSMIDELQKGATRQGLTKAQIEEFEVPLPPISEQRRIASYLDTLQEESNLLMRLQTEVSTELESLLPSSVDKAFRGEL
jgi:type I restriction enzyme S subunit